MDAYDEQIDLFAHTFDRDRDGAPIAFIEDRDHARRNPRPIVAGMARAVVVVRAEGRQPWQTLASLRTHPKDRGDGDEPHAELVALQHDRRQCRRE